MLNLALYPAWMAEGQRVSGNIPGDDTACADDRTVTYRYAGHDHTVSANPDMVADSNRLGPADMLVAAGTVEWVMSGIDLHVRANKYVVTDANRGAIEQREVEIDKDMAANCGIDAVIDIDLFFEMHIVANRSKQALQYR